MAHIPVPELSVEEGGSVSATSLSQPPGCPCGLWLTWPQVLLILQETKKQAKPPCHSATNRLILSGKLFFLYWWKQSCLLIL